MGFIEKGKSIKKTKILRVEAVKQFQKFREHMLSLNEWTNKKKKKMEKMNDKYNYSFRVWASYKKW